MAECPPTITNIIEQASLRWIFVGGKGGVGKTTTACSIAVQLAQRGVRTLLISTDPAHNLSDALQQKIGSAPTPVQGVVNLSAMEVDPSPQKLEVAGLSEEDGGFLQDLASSIPGIDEAMSFGEVMKLVKGLEHDTVVFDTAPTGHTLRLIQFPDTIGKALSKLQRLQGTVAPLMSAIGPMLGGSQADASQLFGKLEELRATVAEVKEQFQDAELTTFVCVCIPEFLSLYETERLVQELAKQDIDVHNIVINQIIYKGPRDFSGLLDARIRSEGGRVHVLVITGELVQMQQKYLDQYDELYGEDMHLVKMPLLREEVRGIGALESFSALLVEPYQPPVPATDDPFERIATLEAELAALKG